MITPNESLKKAKEALAMAIAEKKRNQELINGLGPAVIETLKPVLREIALNSKLSKNELLDAISNININVPQAQIPQAQVDVKIPDIIVPEPKVTVNVPEIKAPIIPEIKIPKIVVPKPQVTINVPPVKIPDLKWPKEKMPIEGWVQLQGVDLGHPLPVQLRDADGKPVNLFENLTTLVGGGGGVAKIVKISNIPHVIVDSIPAGAAGLTDAELRAASVDMRQANGAVWSVSVNDAFRTTVASALINSDDRLRVSLETGGAGLTDLELRAAHLDVLQLSGSVDSVWVNGFNTSVAATIIDSSGVGYSGSNPLPVTITAGAGATSASNIVDSTGVAYTGSNPLPVDGDFYPVTQPISAAALPLPAGAATSALQLADGHNVTIDNIGGAAAVNIQDGGNTITVDGTVVVSGITASTAVVVLDRSGNPLVANSIAQGDSVSALRTIQAGDSISSVNVVSTVGITGTVAVSGITGTVGANIVDSFGNAYTTTNPVPIDDAGGAITVDGTVIVSSITATTGTNIVDSTGVAYETANPLPVTIISGAGATSAVNISDSSGVGYSGSNPIPITGAITGTVAVSGVTASVQATIIDSSGVGYSGTNPLPVVFGAAATTGSNIVDSSGVAYSGSNPVPITGTVVVGSSTQTTGANIIDSSGVAYTTANPLPIGDAGGSVTVDGTFYQVTQPVSAASLPLPAGAASSALQLPDGHNVTVDNAGGGSAVNIQDGGNTITVDGTVAVSGVTASVQASIIDSSGVGYSGTNPLPVVFGAAGTSASNIVDSSGVAYSGSNPVPTYGAVSGTVVVSGITASVAASNIDSTGVQYSGSNPFPFTLAATNATTTMNVRVVDSGNVGYAGANPFPITVITNATSTVNAVLVDSAGAYRGTVPVSGTVVASGITASVAATIIDSGGAGYSNTNPMTAKIGDGVDTLDLTQTLADNVNATVTLPVAGYNYGYESGTWDRLMSTDGRLQIADGGASISVDDGAGTLSVDGTVAVSGVTASVQATIIDSTGVGYSGSNPVPITGLIRPVQVRGSLKTAYVTENEIQEVVLLAGVASEFHDLIFAMCANESTGAINLDFRQTTGGTVQMSVEVPANGTAGVSVPIPIPQDHADATWTVQNSATDNSNTVYSVTALFSKET